MQKYKTSGSWMFDILIVIVFGQKYGTNCKFDVDLHIKIVKHHLFLSFNNDNNS